jgi:hypothetical protein
MKLIVLESLIYIFKLNKVSINFSIYYFSYEMRYIIIYIRLTIQNKQREQKSLIEDNKWEKPDFQHKTRRELTGGN